MWQYNYNPAYSSDDELYHHGILGMKWGVRRYQNSDGSLTSKGRQRISRSTNRIQKDINSLKPHARSGLRSTDGRTMLTSKDVHNQIKELELNKAKKEQKIKDRWDSKTYANNINKNRSIGDKLIYNKNTYRRVYQIMKKKNMSELDATKKAKGEAWLTTAAIMGLNTAWVLASTRR